MILEDVSTAMVVVLFVAMLSPTCAGSPLFHVPFVTLMTLTTATPSSTEKHAEKPTHAEPPLLEPRRYARATPGDRVVRALVETLGQHADAWLTAVNEAMHYSVARERDGRT